MIDVKLDQVQVRYDLKVGWKRVGYVAVYPSGRCAGYAVVPEREQYVSARNTLTQAANDVLKYLGYGPMRGRVAVERSKRGIA